MASVAIVVVFICIYWIMQFCGWGLNGTSTSSSSLDYQCEVVSKGNIDSIKGRGMHKMEVIAKMWDKEIINASVVYFLTRLDKGNQVGSLMSTAFPCWVGASAPVMGNCPPKLECIELTSSDEFLFKPELTCSVYALDGGKWLLQASKREEAGGIRMCLTC